MYTTYFPSYYRAAGLIVFGVWCWGFNVQVLSKYGVSAQTTLQMDPTPNFSHTAIYTIAAMLTFIFTSNLMMFALTLPTLPGQRPSVFWPVMLYLSFVGFLVMPINLLRIQRSTFIRYRRCPSAVPCGISHTAAEPASAHLQRPFSLCRLRTFSLPIYSPRFQKLLVTLR